ncbi:LPS export ABC transporter periplasmic protein LptC [Flavobacterium sp. MXW15]|uniref:Lipopolysaccharide export system protein LptC n=1 Tax=Xanthomonas chitinilytica TaxID=2989819 RepID=A0ABT3JUI1_9XANT|nr:LPS export ABC transporter periplasmic protein LptC [Xanthomonas sp. H13-6]MCW4453495.1 LPS export ABC transporter periplasmic protein LptC [Flavobacterium sp. MXW15]MCW4472152.1 LPS export ABC transporter periplasmic protein LptC [Xanthomonas sp. H13-6]
MSWRSVLGIALLLAAIVSGWSAWQQRDAITVAATDEGSSDYVLRDFEIIALDEQGKESTTLRAPTMERSRSDETMTIDQPLFLLPDRDGRHWQLRARTGWVSAKGEEMRLRGDVSGDSPRDGDIPVTTFRTQSLDVFPERNLARTDDKVTMTRPGIMQTGVGFEADLKSSQYRLLSQVKTRYEPNAAR